mmetsp:Transcript_35125/g.33375  ORF Transcript_35125/g.33375 Transcript_35125/m.33375 type:complete len:200 (+) Transcript_35125:180-779(+)
MTSDFIQLKVLGVSENIATKIQNVYDQRTFSDLLDIAKTALRDEGAVYNKDDMIIYVKGSQFGGGGNISTIVQANENIADICFDPDLFTSTPKIEIIFNYFSMNFSFMKGGTKQSCNLEYLYGSKSYGKLFMNDARNKESFFEYKLTQKSMRDRFGGIMEGDCIVFNSENCAVFIVHPLAPFKGMRIVGMLSYLGTPYI